MNLQVVALVSPKHKQIWAQNSRPPAICMSQKT